MEGSERASRRVKEEQRVYRLRDDTGWRINNCITDAGGQIRPEGLEGERKREASGGRSRATPFRGLPDKAARINAHISIIIAGAL